MKPFEFDDTAHGPTWLAERNKPRPTREPLPTPHPVSLGALVEADVETNRRDRLWILVPALALTIAVWVGGAVAFYLRGK